MLSFRKRITDIKMTRKSNLTCYTDKILKDFFPIPNIIVIVSKYPKARTMLKLTNQGYN